MLRPIIHKNIDKKKWDACIDASPNGLIYAKSWYLDIVSPNWEAIVEGDYESVMPLTVKKKWGIKYMFTPPFVRQLGIFSKNKISNLEANAFLKNAKKGMLFISYNLNIASTFGNVKLLSNQYIPLDKDFNQLQLNFVKKHKKNIRLAQHNNLQITVYQSADFFQLLASYPQPFLSATNIAQLKQICAYCDTNKMSEYIGVSDQDNAPLLILFLIKTKNSVYDLVSAYSPVSKENKARFLVINHIIKKYARQYKRFDFCGSSLEGVKKFNLGFGAENEEYSRIENYPFKILKNLKII